MKVYLFFAISMLVSCRHVNNKFSDSIYICGPEIKRDQPFLLLESFDGDPVSGHDITVQSLNGDGDAFSVSRKGCVQDTRNGQWLVRSRSRNESTIVNLPDDYSLKSIKLNPNTDYITSPVCPNNVSLNSFFDSNSLIQIAKRGSAATLLGYDLEDANGKSIYAQELRSVTQNPNYSFAPKKIPEGEFTLVVKVRNLVNNETITKKCDVEIDFTTPLMQPNFMKSKPSTYLSSDFYTVLPNETQFFESTDASLKNSEICWVRRTDLNEGVSVGGSKGKCSFMRMSPGEAITLPTTEGFYDFSFRHSDRSGNTSEIYGPVTVFFEQSSTQQKIVKLFELSAANLERNSPLASLRATIETLSAVQISNELPTKFERDKLKDLQYLSLYRLKQRNLHYSMKKIPVLENEIVEGVKWINSKLSLYVIARGTARLIQIRKESQAIREFQIPSHSEKVSIRKNFDGNRIVILVGRSLSTLSSKDFIDWNFATTEIDSFVSAVDINPEGNEIELLGDQGALSRCDFGNVVECEVFDSFDIPELKFPDSSVFLDSKLRQIHVQLGSQLYTHYYDGSGRDKRNFTIGAEYIPNLVFARFKYFMPEDSRNLVLLIEDQQNISSVIYQVKFGENDSVEFIKMASFDYFLEVDSNEPTVWFEDVARKLSFLSKDNHLVTSQSYDFNKNFRNFGNESQVESTVFLGLSPNKNVIVHLVFDEPKESRFPKNLILRQYEVVEGYPKLMRSNTESFQIPVRNSMAFSQDNKYFSYSSDLSTYLYQWNDRYFDLISSKANSPRINSAVFDSNNNLYVTTHDSSLYRYSKNFEVLEFIKKDSFENVLPMMAMDIERNAIYRMKREDKGAKLSLLSLDPLAETTLDLSAKIADTSVFRIEDDKLILTSLNSNTQGIVELSLDTGYEKWYPISMHRGRITSFVRMNETRLLVTAGASGPMFIQHLDYPTFDPVPISSESAFRSHLLSVSKGVLLAISTQSGKLEDISKRMYELPSLDSLLQFSCGVISDYLENHNKNEISTEDYQNAKKLCRPYH